MHILHEHLKRKVEKKKKQEKEGDKRAIEHFSALFCKLANIRSMPTEITLHVNQISGHLIILLLLSPDIKDHLLLEWSPRAKSLYSLQI